MFWVCCTYRCITRLHANTSWGINLIHSIFKVRPCIFLHNPWCQKCGQTAGFDRKRDKRVPKNPFLVQGKDNFLRTNRFSFARSVQLRKHRPRSAAAVFAWPFCSCQNKCHKHIVSAANEQKNAPCYTVEFNCSGSISYSDTIEKATKRPSNFWKVCYFRYFTCTSLWVIRDSWFMQSAIWSRVVAMQNRLALLQ